MTAAASRRRLVSIAEAAAGARAAGLRFPGALGAALAAAALLVAGVHTDFRSNDLLRAAQSAALGISLLFAVELAAERAAVGRAPRALLDLAAVLALIAHFWVTRGDDTTGAVLRYAQLALALHLLVAFAPFAGRGEPNGFWQFNQRLFVRFFEASLYGGVFFVGLAVALWGVGLLFDRRIPSEVFADLAFVSTFVVQTWRFLAVVPRPLDGLQHDPTYPGSLRVFTQYLLVPLALLYGVILYAYVARILVFWSWPKGLVAWLISGASIFGMTTLLFLHPARDRPEARWIGTYSRWFYPAILPLLGVLFLALGQRIGQYAITERRYFLGALGLWLFGIAVYFIATRSQNIVVIPVSLCAVALLTAFGPWGAYQVSEKSQQRRLVALLDRNGLLAAGKARPAARPVAWEEQRELSRLLDYLLDHHGGSAVAPWFAPTPARREDAARRRHGDTKAQGSLMAQLGLSYVEPWASASERHYRRDTRSGEALDVRGYDRVVEVSLSGIVPFTVDGVAHSVRLEGRAPALEISRGTDVILRVPLEPLLARLAAHGTTTVPDPLMTVIAEDAPLAVKIVFRTLTVHRRPDGRSEPRYGAALLCLRMR